MRFWLATLIFSKQLRSCFKVIFQLIPSIRLDAPVLWIKATSKSVFNSSTLASRNNSCLPCVRVCYQLFEFKDSFIDSFIDSFEALFVLLFRYLFLISLRIVFSLKLHYFFTIFHYFIVFASELSNARISGFANTFARSSGSTSSATVALLFSCCTCICGSRFFFS